jgi:hypothetical protein
MGRGFSPQDAGQKPAGTPVFAAQGIEAEILFCRPRQKRLERIARFPALCSKAPEMRPKH